MISESATNAMIAAWKRARLSPGTEALGYPTENILSKAGKGRTIGRPPLPPGERTDAELVQFVVDKMPDEIRATFEAYHLKLIRKERCGDMPHKARALILGIAPSTYFLRKDAAFRFCQEWLTDLLDRIGPQP